MPTQMLAASRVRNLIAAEEGGELATALHVLPQQGGMVRHFGGNSAAIWSRCLEKLPPEPLRFALNAAVDTLPTNYNLHKWGKRTSAVCPLCSENRQSLQHVLNSCLKAMELRRYSERHDQVLHILSSFMECHLPPSFSISTAFMTRGVCFLSTSHQPLFGLTLCGGPRRDMFCGCVN